MEGVSAVEIEGKTKEIERKAVREVRIF